MGCFVVELQNVSVCLLEMHVRNVWVGVLVGINRVHVQITADAYAVCAAHALSTEREEIMGLLLG